MELHINLRDHSRVADVGLSRGLLTHVKYVGSIPTPRAIFTLGAILLFGCVSPTTIPRIPDVLLDFKDSFNCSNLTVGPIVTWRLDGDMKSVKVNPNTKEMEYTKIPKPNILLRCEKKIDGQIRAEDIVRSRR